MRYRKTISSVAITAMVFVACGTDTTVTAEPTTVAATPETTTSAEVPTDTADAAATPEASPAVSGDLTYAIVSTGQNACYDDTGNTITCPDPGSEFFGQDASYETTAASYQDNGDGTVTDLVTGLMWQADPGDKMTYAEAVSGGLVSVTLSDPQADADGRTEASLLGDIRVVDAGLTAGFSLPEPEARRRRGSSL